MKTFNFEKIFKRLNKFLTEYKFPLVIFGLAITIRLLVYELGEFAYLGKDERVYWKLAGKFLSKGFSETYFLPGWPFILSKLRFLEFGVHEVRLFVVFVGSISCVLVGLIGKNIYGERIGWLSGLLMSFYPNHIFFSHYIQAEIVLSFILIIFTYLSFKSYGDISSAKVLYGSIFFLGCGLLYKHFAIIAFVSFMMMYFIVYRKLSLNIVIIGIMFFMPLLLFSLYNVSRGKDPMMWINSPIKSAREWKKSRPRSRHEVTQKKEVVKDHVASIVEKGSGYWFHKSKRNIYLLWSPNSRPITRIYMGKYGSIFYYRWLIYFIAVITILVVVTGLTCLFYSDHEPFKIYTILNFLILTSMGLVWFLVARYRFPFMFLLIIYSARFFIDFKQVKFWIRNKNILTHALYILTMLILGTIYMKKLPYLGSWY